MGRVVAEWLNDGRDMRLIEDFGYVDPQGRSWNAPAGSVVNGASIPQLAWSVIGGPFEGKYREASVIHDVACVAQGYSWQETHEAFYTAMMASGVEGLRAKVMYAAVYHFGPRWGQTVRAASDIPLKEVERETDRARAMAAQRGDRVADVNVQKRATRFPESLWKGSRADLSIRVEPAPALSDPIAFQTMRELIEREDPSLDAIRALGGP